jgi:hypothetical protein
MVFNKKFFPEKAIFSPFQMWNSYLILLIFGVLVLESLDRWSEYERGLKEVKSTPCSAFVRVGNLWGEIEQTGSFIGPSAHRLTWWVLLTSFNPLSYNQPR